MKTEKENIPTRQHARHGPPENRGQGNGTTPNPAKKCAEERLGRLNEEMRTFIEKSFMDDESLVTLNRCSPHQQYKIYDYACSDLYGEIDAVVAKCLLGGKMPAGDSAMQEVLVEILDAAFSCAVSIAGPKEEFRKLLESRCKRLVEIADSEGRPASHSRKAGQGDGLKQKAGGRKHARQGRRFS